MSGDTITKAIVLSLRVIGAIDLGSYGIRGLMADMTPDQRRFFIRFSSATGGCALAGISFVLGLAWAAGHLR